MHLDEFKDEAELCSRQSDSSLASLSTNAIEIVNGILQPGMMSNANDEDEGATQLVHPWQETVSKADRRRKEGRLMPGTLASPGSSFLPTEPASSQDAKHVSAISKADLDESLPRTTHIKPLAQSMSVEERRAFLDGLAEISKAPPATVYTLPVDDLAPIQQSASKLGFHTRALLLSSKSEDEDGLLIVGKDTSAVDAVYERLSRDVKKGAGLRAINAVAGGAVVGAVVTFTGLAFS